MRKECESLRRIGVSVRVVVLADDNVADTHVVWSGVHVQSLKLVTRRWFHQARGLAFKLLEFNGRAFVDILRRPPDVLWCHNLECAPLVAGAVLLRRFGRIRRVIWDQHELPGASVMRSRLGRRTVARLMRACDAVVVANAERRQYLVGQLPGASHVQFSLLENLADRWLRDLPVHPLRDDIRKWARGRPYVLLQGGARPGRHFPEVVHAVIDQLDVDVGLVVIGSRPESLVTPLEARWGADFSDHVFFTGWIPQMEIPSLIDHAVASLVLYEATTPNSLHCAPNRLYQAIARGTPVIVGANPSMAGLVAERNLGVVVEGTGRSPEDIARAIRDLLRDPTRHRDALALCREALLWENQDGELARLVACQTVASDRAEGAAIGGGNP